MEMHPWERLDDLQCGGLKIIQDPSAYCFGTDAVLLAEFAHTGPKDRVCDLGTGCGVIPLLLYARGVRGELVGIELQQKMADLARRNMALNKLTGEISVLHEDLRALPSHLRGFDAVTCNPPYGRPESSVLTANPVRALARYELACTLSDVMSAAYKLLRNGGRLVMVHQAFRLAEIFREMEAVRLSPKRVRLVQSRADKGANLVLVEGIREGREGLQWLPTLVVRDHMGEYTPDMREIYRDE